MKAIALGLAVITLMMVPGFAFAQQLACPGGGQPVVVQPQQYVPQVTQPVVQPPPVTNTTDPLLLKIVLGIQAQVNNLQNEIAQLKTTPAVVPPPSNNGTLPPPPPPDSGGGQQTGSCPNQGSCPNSGGGPYPSGPINIFPGMYGPGYNPFNHFGNFHGGGGGHGPGHR